MLHRTRPLGIYGLVSLALVLIMTSAADAQNQDTQTTKKDFAIVIHGGAGGDPVKWTEEYRQQRLDGLTAALQRGVELLSSGAPAVDVVEQVIKVMEDDETFNAGRGCVLNEQGEHGLDASIMDGRDLSCGAVAGIRRTRNPISVARKVMSDTKHILLMGSGADEFAAAAGMELAEDSYFRTPRQLANWERWKNKEADVSLHLPSTVRPGDKPLYLGTVGCVVLDQHGNLAAGTSTGGLMGKRWGRVGDSPIIGAGNYADNATCAVSGTGVGEEFIRHCVAGDIAAQMRYAHMSLSAATQAVVAKLPENCGGVIAVDARGNLVVEFNTPGMSHAFADSTGRSGVRLSKE